MHKLMTQDPNSAPPRTPQLVSTALIMAMALGGVLMLAIVLGLVVLGMRIDQALSTRPWVTLGMVVLSAPFTIWALYHLMMRAVKPKAGKSQGG